MERVILDTNILVAVIGGEEPGYSAAATILGLIADGSLTGVISTVTIAELSAGFRSAGDEQTWMSLIPRLSVGEGFEVAPLDAETADLAGRIRAETGLRLPDAAIVATGITRRTEAVITYDKELARAKDHIRVLNPSQYRSKDRAPS